MSKLEVFIYVLGAILAFTLPAYELLSMVILGFGLSFLLRKGGSMK